jgi:hypothetical protein
LRRRFWVETALAGATAFLALLTLVSKEWIEIVFRVDPDHGSGELEWLIVAAMVVATVTFAVLARLEYRRSAPAAV